MKKKFNSIDIIVIITIVAIVMLVASMAVLGFGVEYHNETILNAGVIIFAASFLAPIIGITVYDAFDK